MITKLEEAVERIKKSLPNVRQDEVGQWLLDFVDQEQSDVRLSKEQEAEVHRRVHESPEKPVSEEEAAAFISKFT